MSLAFVLPWLAAVALVSDLEPLPVAPDSPRPAADTRPTLGDPGPTAPGALRSGADTLEARPGDRLVLQDFEGRLHVRAGPDDLVRVLSPRVPSGAGPRLSRSGDRIGLSGPDPGGPARGREVVVEVPRWLALELRAAELDVRVEGLAADVSVRTGEGDLLVRDVQGTVRLWSVDGEIRVEDVRGRVSARSVDESVTLVRITGDVEAGSTDGDLRLADVGGARVDAETVDGDIAFDGALRPGGTYTLVTHDGDLSVRIPEAVGVDVDVSTFDGSFEAEFPVTLERFRGGREASFTLGEGGARLVLQAFDGDIRLGYRR